jgi:parallel beta-helix repeat protein
VVNSCSTPNRALCGACFDLFSSGSGHPAAASSAYGDFGDPAGYGILLWDANNNIVQNNSTTGNVANGIYVDATPAGNTFTGNTATGNDLGGSDGGYDVYDASAGNRTGGTADTWSGNTFGTAFPPGLG